ncbi:MAG: hypothetical protein Q7S60_05605 [bacterium]|nr:hypothetical protein [bacterium]
MDRIVRSTIAAAALLLLSVGNIGEVAAQYVPQAQPTKKLEIIKRVKHPENGQFRENIYSSEYTFTKDKNVTFQLEVKNSGQAEFRNIQVKDKLPSVLEFSTGPGSIDKDNAALNIQIDRLGAGETKFLEFNTRIKMPGNLAPDATPCFTNFSEARVDDMYSSDTSVFCIRVSASAAAPAPKELPKAGPEGWFVVLGLSILSGTTGFYLLRFSNAKI